MKKVAINYELLKGTVAGKQQKIAQELEVSQATLSFWINNKRTLTLENLNRIARVLGRDAGEFLKFDGQVLKDIKIAA